MKKIRLLTLWLLTLFWLGSFCNSELLSTTFNNVGGSSWTWELVFDTNSVYCIYASYNNSNRRVFVDFQNFSWYVNTHAMNPWPLCFNVWNNDNILKYEFQGGSYVQLYYFKVIEYTVCDYSDYVPVSDYNTCLSELNTATWNYLSCQSSISWYVNSLNNCSSNLNSCNTSLSSCLSANCPNNTWDISWSALFINNIQHLWSPVIRITIPEEFDRDYAYTDSWNNMEIDIEGYNVDTDYISWIIDVQRSKPSSEDFNSIISDVLPLFVPWLVIILFIYFVFKFIKKIF